MSVNPIIAAAERRSANGRQHTAAIQPRAAEAPREPLPPRPWDKPVPLADAPTAPTFPDELLPPRIRQVIGEIAWALNVPRDLVGLPVLVLAGGAIGNAVHLGITRSHHQPPCIYGAIVARPGMLKSPALNFLRRPLDRAEVRRRQEWTKKMDEWKAGDAEGRGPKPVLSRGIVGDTTTESLALTIHDNPRGVVMVRGELAGLLSSMDQYRSGKGHDRQVYLDLWDGSTLVVDRKSDKSRDGAPIHVNNPFCGIVGAIQPERLRDLQGGEKGRSADDGFVDRWLFAYPDETPVIGEQWREVSEEAERYWEEMIDNLLSLQMTSGPYGLRPHLVSLTADARLQWERFTASLADEMNAEDFPDFLRGPWSKLRGYGARLALIIQQLWRASGATNQADVSGDAMVAGAELVAYFKAHAKKAYAVMDADREAASAKAILRWIARERRTEFKPWEAFSDLKSRARFPTPKHLEAPVERLVKHGYLRLQAAEPRTGPGRPPQPAYEVNPLWNRPDNPGNPANSAPPPHSRVFRDSQDDSPGEECGRGPFG